METEHFQYADSLKFLSMRRFYSNVNAVKMRIQRASEVLFGVQGKFELIVQILANCALAPLNLTFSDTA